MPSDSRATGPRSAISTELLRHVGENPNTLHILGLCHERLGTDDKALEYATRVGLGR